MISSWDSAAAAGGGGNHLRAPRRAKFFYGVGLEETVSSDIFAADGISWCGGNVDRRHLL
jgi:hypothetical protein